MLPLRTEFSVLPTGSLIVYLESFRCEVLPGWRTSCAEARPTAPMVWGTTSIGIDEPGQAQAERRFLRFEKLVSIDSGHLTSDGHDRMCKSLAELVKMAHEHFKNKNGGLYRVSDAVITIGHTQYSCNERGETRMLDKQAA